MSSLSNVSYLILLQLSSRIITFILNTSIARIVGPYIYGIININYYLIYTTILFISRESLRRSSLRLCNINNNDNKEQINKKILNMINISWLCSIPLSIVIAVVLYTYSSNNDDNYNLGLFLFAVSAVIEMLAEPLYVVVTLISWIKIRVYIELIAILLRTFIVAICVLYFDTSLIGFAYGQLAYSIFLNLTYYCVLYYNRLLLPFDFSCLFPTFKLNRELFKLTSSFTLQSLEKLALTEGEKFVLAGFNTSKEESGVYSLVSNVGSLVARTLFQPLEECAYSDFSRLVNKENNLFFIEKAGQTLICLLKTVVFLGLCFVFFGPFYSYVVFDLFYGIKWSLTSAPIALSCYCLYILIMAMNGITEAFVFATIPASKLNYYNIWLLVFSVFYILASILLIEYGSVGLILANCCNLLARIIYSTVFIVSFFESKLSNQDSLTDKPLAAALSSTINFFKTIFPSFLLNTVFIFSSSILYMSYNLFNINGSSSFALNIPFSQTIRYLMHISVGAILFISILVIFWITEKDFISIFKNIMGYGSSKTKIN